MQIVSNFTESYQKLLGDQVLFNGVHNFSIFSNSLGWTKQEYFKRWFENSLPCISFSVGQGTKSTYWVTETHFNAIAREVFLKYWNNPSLLSELENGRKEYTTEIAREYQRLSRDFLLNESESVVLGSLKHLNDLQGYANCNGWYTFGFEQSFVIELLKESGSTITPERLSELWETLIMPVTLSFDKRSALKVFDLLDQGHTLDQLTEELEYLYAGFFGLPNPEVVRTKINEEWLAYSTPEVRHRLREEILTEQTTREQDYQKWLETLSFQEQRLATYVKHIIMVRDSMRDTVGMTIAVFARLTHQWARDWNIAHEILDFLTFEELLKGKESVYKLIPELTRRHDQGFAIFVHPNEEIIAGYDAVGARQFMERLFIQQHGLELSAQVTTIKGVPASKGLVTGTAKIITDLKSDWDKMQSGDILVTGMTRPEFVPLMKMAAAVVTDEGGITCHAAIVSRELKIPCIIGTKNATQVLKDGDRVEVDANSGKVTILGK